jgi:acyl carrier protein
MLPAKEIQARVAKVLMETLSAEETDIIPSATLFRDLGAESIDLLDIVFRLEREFGISIDRDELFPESIFQGDPHLVQDGVLTDGGMAKLRAALPNADFSGFERDRRASGVPDLLTVGQVANFIDWKLRQTATNGRAIRGLDQLASNQTAHF